MIPKDLNNDKFFAHCPYNVNDFQNSWKWWRDKQLYVFGETHDILPQRPRFSMDTFIEYTRDVFEKTFQYCSMCYCIIGTSSKCITLFYVFQIWSAEEKAILVTIRYIYTDIENILHFHTWTRRWEILYI